MMSNQTLDKESREQRGYEASLRLLAIPPVINIIPRISKTNWRMTKMPSVSLDPKVRTKKLITSFPAIDVPRMISSLAPIRSSEPTSLDTELLFSSIPRKLNNAFASVDGVLEVAA